MSSAEVCRPCGACCAATRVVFAETEVEGKGGEVPAWLAAPVSPAGHVALRGTLGAEPRCEALSGTVGEETGCRIYARRPGPCRRFQPSRPGEINPWCDAARARHGMTPLVG